LLDLIISQSPRLGKEKAGEGTLKGTKLKERIARTGARCGGRITEIRAGVKNRRDSSEPLALSSSNTVYRQDKSLERSSKLAEDDYRKAYGTLIVISEIQEHRTEQAVRSIITQS